MVKKLSGKPYSHAPNGEEPQVLWVERRKTLLGLPVFILNFERRGVTNVTTLD